MLLYEQFVELARAWVIETNYLPHIYPGYLKREFHVSWDWSQRALKKFEREGIIIRSFGPDRYCWEKVKHEPS
jgi:hypothetical protein